MLSRRDLLIHSAALSVRSGIVSLGARASGLWLDAAAAAEPRADATILVLIELTGGNDGLNTVVPRADDIYYKSRPTLGVEPAKVLKLNDHVGLHPSLKDLHALWQSGDLAVIQGVGYPNPNRSHTRSMEIWQTGSLGPAPPAGWVGRVADANSRLGACHVGEHSVPLAIRGQKTFPQALASLAEYRLAAGARLQAESPEPVQPADPLVAELRRRFAAARDLATRLSALNSPGTPSSSGELSDSLRSRLETVRRLIEADLPLRVYYTSLGGFDTHASQAFVHQDLLRRVSQAVGGFSKNLKGSRLDERVLVLLFSEFGRRLKENATHGTDHGSAAPVLVAGPLVQGGLIGPPPNLADLDDAGDPRFTTDFRDVYATLLRQWLGVDPEPILGKRNSALPFLEG
jgi:uncharacterized protein (DUF1501 family)